MLKLNILNGYIRDDKFFLRGIGDHPMRRIYTSEELVGLAMQIKDDEPFGLGDERKTIFVPVEVNPQIRHEMRLIASKIERVRLKRLRKRLEQLDSDEHAALAVAAFDIFSRMGDNYYAKEFFDIVKGLTDDEEGWK
jgi:hypothetical protein